MAADETLASKYKIYEEENKRQHYDWCVNSGNSHVGWKITESYEEYSLKEENQETHQGFYNDYI